MLSDTHTHKHTQRDADLTPTVSYVPEISHQTGILGLLVHFLCCCFSNAGH